MSEGIQISGKTPEEVQKLIAGGIGAVKTFKPQLQLLVIDLGDSCVVKIESGSRGHNVEVDGRWYTLTNCPTVILRPFPELRDAIEGEKPVPRIERHSHRYMLFAQRHGTAFQMLGLHYEAFCELAGKPLPIYEGGKWEELIALQAKDESGNWRDAKALTVWRYTR